MFMQNCDIKCNCGEERFNKIDGWYYDPLIEVSPAYSFDPNKDEDLLSSSIHPVICQKCYNKLSEDERQKWRSIPLK